VEPQPPQSPTPPPPAQEAGEPALSGLPTTCPVCGESREVDDRFCEACGHDFTVPGSGPAAAPKIGSRGLIILLIILIWAAICIGGLFYLYNGMYRL
jgi:uncharacterized protein (DUF983 family)